jgi:hypothetical protein
MKYHWTRGDRLAFAVIRAPLQVRRIGRFSGVFALQLTTSMLIDRVHILGPFLIFRRMACLRRFPRLHLHTYIF